MSVDMLRCCAILLLCCAARAQNGKAAAPPRSAQPPAAAAVAKPSAPASAKEAMAASLELQRASIRKQTGSTAASSSFFTVPWLDPPPVAPQLDAGCDPLPASELDPIIAEAAQKNQLQPELIRAVVRQESGGRPCAVSEKGALGLMQLMPAIVEQFTVRDPFAPRENVAAGSKFLKQLLTRFKGDLRLALGAYNAGPESIPENGAVPDLPETRNYVQSIMDSLGKQ
jgi:soluble lytic murein transglycosylase-like protein